MDEQVENISIRRTGNLFSFSSVEFEVTFPDGNKESLWSPPWSDLDYDDPRQDEGAMKKAREIWDEKVAAASRNRRPHRK